MLCHLSCCNKKDGEKNYWQNRGLQGLKNLCCCRISGDNVCYLHLKQAI
jgi:hypothetical protein